MVEGTREGKTAGQLGPLYLLVLLHGGVELLGEVVGDVGQGGLLLVGPAQAALVLVGLLAVLLLGVLAVALAPLSRQQGAAQPGPFPATYTRDTTCLGTLHAWERQHRGLSIPSGRTNSAVPKWAQVDLRHPASCKPFSVYSSPESISFFRLKALPLFDFSERKATAAGLLS